MTKNRFKKGRLLGKYRLLRRLGAGGFGEVWKAWDDVAGIFVALKIPFPAYADAAGREDFRREAHVLASLDHPNILRMKTAEVIEPYFLIVFDLGQGTLAKKLKTPLTLKNALFYFEQMVAALAFAHAKKVIHRDIKPENFIFFSGDTLRLGDFGVAKILADKHLTSTVSGTLGYMAPEQAYGQPTMASDVFSAGLILFKMLTGTSPRWPFTWPFPGLLTLRRKAPPALEMFIHRACAFEPKERFPDALHMQREFLAIKETLTAKKKKQNPKSTPARRKKKSNRWDTIRKKDFRKFYTRALNLKFSCVHCQGPTANAFAFCPWCRKKHVMPSKTKNNCKRCHRHLQPDWPFCAFCYGPRRKSVDGVFRPNANYVKACPNRKCSRRLVFPFSRFCPWCRAKINRPWTLPPFEKCDSCRWPIARKDWDFCPWCRVNIRQ